LAHLHSHPLGLDCAWVVIGVAALKYHNPRTSGGIFL
jgi:hypothetical protein